MNLEDTIALVGRLFLIFTAARIRVIRMGLQDDPALTGSGAILAGPFHPAFGEHVYSTIFYRLARTAIKRHPRGPSTMVIRVHPRHLSQTIGPGRSNLARLRALTGDAALTIQADATVAPHHLEVDNAAAPIASR
jgi:hypothetical protein